MENEQLVLLLSTFFSLSFAVTYSREFQLNLDMEYFAQAREFGFERYLNSFAVNGLTVANMSQEVSYRTQGIIPLHNCQSHAKVRLRHYIQGDVTGYTLDLNSGIVSSEEEALGEPFAVASEFTTAEHEIKYEIHPCHAEYAATARIYSESPIQTIDSCNDVREYFPVFSTYDGGLKMKEPSNVVYVQANKGSAWGGNIKVEFTLYYHSQEEAEYDVNPIKGEFSFTIFSLDDDQYTEEQTKKGIEVYNYMLNDIGDASFPCHPPATIADFFDPVLNNRNSGTILSSVNIIFWAATALFFLQI